jgi:hypothetical protein
MGQETFLTRNSALCVLYDAAIISDKHNEPERIRLSQSMEATSKRIVEFSSLLFGDVEKINYDRLSPFVPHSLYQAAVVQLRSFKQTNEIKYKENLDSIKTILGYFNKRWIGTGKYLVALDTFKTDWPITLFPVEGFSVSAKGPIGENPR